MTHQGRFQAAVSAALAGATVITANSRAARDVRSACEARLAATRRIWRTPDILSLEGWRRGLQLRYSRLRRTAVTWVTQSCGSRAALRNGEISVVQNGTD